MSTPDTKDDELAGTEAPFIEHLVELRDRLIRIGPVEVALEHGKEALQALVDRVEVNCRHAPLFQRLKR